MKHGSNNLVAGFTAGTAKVFRRLQGEAGIDDFNAVIITDHLNRAVFPVGTVHHGIHQGFTQRADRQPY